MFKKAFTLSEILITLTVLGFIAVAMIRSLRTDNLNEKTNALKAYKVINIFDQASSNIKDSVYCPLGKFIIKNVDTYESAVALPENVMDMYGEFLKLERTYDDFRSNSLYNFGEDPIPGAKIAGDIYFGVEVLDELEECPDFRMPNVEEEIEVKTKPLSAEKPLCWAKLYVDVNGTDAPNAEGEDVYIFGLDENGVHH